MAADIDGTLVAPRSDGTGELQSCLARLEKVGYIVVLVTGRPPRWARSFAASIGYRGFIVASHGAAIMRGSEDAPVSLQGISGDHLRSLQDSFLPEVEILLVLETARDCFAQEGVPAKLVEFWGAVETSQQDLWTHCPAGKSLVLLPHERAAFTLQSRACEWGIVAKRAGQRGLLWELRAAGVSKLTALQRVCQMFGVGAKDVIGLGDMETDGQFLSWAGISVAVGPRLADFDATLHLEGPPSGDVLHWLNDLPEAG